jgi:feruloyl-CoA synthase
MAAEALSWEPESFAADVERRADGSIILRPRRELGEYPARALDMLEHWAREAPDRVFIAQRDKSGAWEQLTYREMLSRVQRIAQGLLARNLSAERPIAILSGNSIEHLLLAFAAMWIGVPYSPISPAYALAAGELKKLKYVLDLLTPGMVAAFGTQAFERPLTQLVAADVEIVGDVPSIGGRKVTALGELEAEPSLDLARAHAQTGPDTIVKLLLTSGSTGEPKAVITTHRMLCSNARMLCQALPFARTEPPVVVDWLPWNHTFGGSHNLNFVLFNGGTLYIDEGKPTPGAIAATLRNLREISPTVQFNVPKGFDALAHHLREDAELRRSFFRRLRACLFGGGSLAQHTMDALDELAIAERGVRVPMLSGLGATETGPSVTFTTPDCVRAGVIGLPAAGNVVKLAPHEGKFELRVTSPSVTPGYWRRPELTSAAFDEEGFYKLGDAARLLDENDPGRGLCFDGRIAEDFKLSSGTWVSVGPLRAKLIAALSPLVQDVAIAGLDRDYLTALLLPDIAACAAFLGVSSVTYDALPKHAELVRALRERLQTHAAQHPASSLCIRRAMLLPSPPSLDQGEITDKGSINQRTMLRLRADCIATLYEPEPPDHVIVID